MLPVFVYAGGRAMTVIDGLRWFGRYLERHDLVDIHPVSVRRS
jgi:hypothetical protein